jgi:16S rRNA (cytosine967-C5)-methyltransferase
LRRAGGKTLHLAAMMENKGQIIAMDIHGWKLTELKRRAKRAGAHNIETREITDNKVIKRLHEKADRLLRCTLFWFGRFEKKPRF